jgi:hypothetical protein
MGSAEATRLEEVGEARSGSLQLLYFFAVLCWRTMSPVPSVRARAAAMWRSPPGR